MTAPQVEAYRRALSRFEEALSEPDSALIRDACIQRFEFCFELAWKSIQQLLRLQGQDCSSPKGCLRQAFKQGWIENEEGWVAILADRNLTSHTYDEALAKAVYNRLKAYLPMFEGLLQRLEAAQA
jgi:nucleotidyltransferase substrate binding protein (TIGR01987 family)